METRLSRLERMMSETNQVEDESIIQRVIDDFNVKQKERTKRENLLDLQYQFKQSCLQLGVNLKNYTRICELVIEFIIDNGPQIAILVGSALTGTIKLNLGIQLVFSLFEDVGVELIGQTIQSVYDLRIEKQHKVAQLDIIKDTILELPPPSPKQKKSCWGRKKK